MIRFEQYDSIRTIWFDLNNMIRLEQYDSIRTGLKSALIFLRDIEPLVPHTIVWENDMVTFSIFTTFKH
jgi:hypothetical protein